jgi:pimeloyl-ACP methyl ester carboxylesterase
MFILTLCTTFALFGLADHSPRTVQQQAALDSMVDVGSHRLHFRIIRGKGPVILLEHGGGDTIKTWESLAPQLAAKTGCTVVAYDRAGFGDSDLPTSPYDIRQEVADLWRALQSLGFTQSLLLAGHSYGGWMIQLFANEHPSAVLGCLFIDPGTADFVDAIGGPRAFWKYPEEQVPFLKALGGIDALTKDQSKPLPETLTKAEKALVRLLRGFPDMIAVMRTVPFPKTAVVRVITKGKPFWPTPGWDPEWRASHERLVASVPHGRLIVAERSGHGIPQEQPDLIIEVIQEMLQPRSGSQTGSL